jgi:hypothetical protein
MTFCHMRNAAIADWCIASGTGFTWGDYNSRRREMMPTRKRHDAADEAGNGGLEDWMVGQCEYT